MTIKLLFCQIVIVMTKLDSLVGSESKVVGLEWERGRSFFNYIFGLIPNFLRDSFSGLAYMHMELKGLDLQYAKANFAGCIDITTCKSPVSILYSVK